MNDFKSQGTKVFSGVRVSSPNQIMEGKNFYVSYNSVDSYIYGCDTTALVWGQMQHFFILCGDHREGYKKAIEGGFPPCAEYFKNNIDQINSYSESPDVLYTISDY